MECINGCWPDQLPDNLPFILPRWDDGDAWKMRGETDAIIYHRMRLQVQSKSNGSSSNGSPNASL
jgi:hypothetical protein